MRKYDIKLTVLAIIILGASLSSVHASDFPSIDAVLKHYNNQLVTLSDLDPDARENFINHEKAKQPGVVKADFNGGGSKDIAILTKGGLFFFLCEKQCREVKSIPYGGFTGIQYIVPVKKGEIVEQTDSVPTESKPAKVRLKNTGVKLVHYGKGIIVYFWDEQKHDILNINTFE
jgi:hypothetical protein